MAELSPSRAYSDPRADGTCRHRRIAAAPRVRLGLGAIEWLPGYGDGVLAFTNNGVTVIANAGTVPVELPVGDIVLASEPITGGVLPADTTVWLRS